MERRATTVNTAFTDGNLPSTHTGRTAGYSKKTSHDVKASPDTWGPRSGVETLSHGARGSSFASPTRPRKQRTHVTPKKRHQKHKGMCDKRASVVRVCAIAILLIHVFFNMMKNINPRCTFFLAHKVGKKDIVL